MATSLQNTFCCADIAQRLPCGMAAHRPVPGDLIYRGPGSRSPAVIGKRKRKNATGTAPIAGNPFSCTGMHSAGAVGGLVAEGLQ